MSRTWVPPCSLEGGGSLAPPLQEFSSMSVSALGGVEIEDTGSVSSADQVTKWYSYVVATRHSHRATSFLAT